MPIVPVYGYRKKTGVTTLRNLIIALCKLYEHFKPSIRGWIDGNMSPEQGGIVRAWLDAAGDVCFIITGTPDD